MNSANIHIPPTNNALCACAEGRPSPSNINADRKKPDRFQEITKTLLGIGGHLSHSGTRPGKIERMNYLEMLSHYTISIWNKYYLPLLLFLLDNYE